jgi:sugar lactone lactonase YvrE
MQIVPDLKTLESKFGDNLLIIGVHSAKFKGEQANARILSAAKRFGLEHPVINDSDFAVWKGFKVEAWPTLVLLGANGQELSRYEGEGHLKNLDADISKHIGSTTKHETSVASLIAKEQQKSVLSFPARIKKYGELFYIADAGNNRIVSVDKDGKIVKTFDGFHSPRGFTVLGDKTLFVADTGAHSLISVDIETGKHETLGGDGERGSVWASPWDVAVTADGNLVIAMAGTHQLQQYDFAKKSLSLFAGNGREAIKDDEATDAELAQPSGLSVAPDGSVYFVDAESSSLRVVKDGQVKTLIGTGLFDFGLKDGAYPLAQMQHAQGLFVKGDVVYLADTYNNAVRTYDIKTGQLSTIKTHGETLNEPGSIWVGDDFALIADTNNSRILKLDLKSGTLSVFPIK